MQILGHTWPVAGYAHLLLMCPQKTPPCAMLSTYPTAHFLDQLCITLPPTTSLCLCTSPHYKPKSMRGEGKPADEKKGCRTMYFCKEPCPYVINVYAGVISTHVHACYTHTTEGQYTVIAITRHTVIAIIRWADCIRASTYVWLPRTEYDLFRMTYPSQLYKRSQLPKKLTDKSS